MQSEEYYKLNEKLKEAEAKCSALADAIEQAHNLLNNYKELYDEATNERNACTKALIDYMQGCK